MSGACNCYALRQATRRVTQLYDRVLAPLGIKATQYSLLSEIGRLGTISLSPLAEVMVMDRATLGHNIRPLEAQGYLRLSVGSDRRNREVSLTRIGRDILARAEVLWRQAQSVYEQELGVQEAAALRAMLRRVARSNFAET
jgi:DNA-binding MarR family transcriptional regulator